MNAQIIGGVLIPFLGTSLGAGMVFFLKKQISAGVQKALTGFAAGVMVAASFWSLLQPALESSTHLGTLAFLPAAVGFLAGMGFLLVLDMITPHMHLDKQQEGPQSGFKRTTKLILAVTLHNIPEGMAVGDICFSPAFPTTNTELVKRSNSFVRGSSRECTFLSSLYSMIR